MLKVNCQLLLLVIIPYVFYPLAQALEKRGVLGHIFIISGAYYPNAYHQDNDYRDNGPDNSEFLRRGFFADVV
jgi:hypothetical protein